MRVEVQTSIDRLGSVWDSLAPRDEVGLESGHLRAIERSGINQLEPFYLVAYEDGVAQGVAYCFVFEMDFGFLEKKLTPEALQTLRSWHPRFLKSRILECGFLSGLGEAIAARGGRRAEVCRATVMEMERIARESQAELLLVRDIPETHQADYASLFEAGFLPLLGYPMARMSVRWSSFEEYLGAQKHSSRWRIRSALTRHSPDLSIETQARYGDLAEKMAGLWGQTHARAKDYSHDVLNAAYFAEVDRHLQGRSHLVTLKRRGELVGFGLCLDGDREYCALHAGFDYAQAGDDNLYGCLLTTFVQDALARGARVINLGITTYEAKFALGFEAEPRIYLVKHVQDDRLTIPFAHQLQLAIPQPENSHRLFHGQDPSLRPDLKALAASIGRQGEGTDVLDKMHRNAVYERANDARLAGLYCFFPPFESAQGPLIRRSGRTVVMLGSNAYLGLGTHPEVVAAARAAIEKYGTGCSGSPFLNGTLDLHVDLARALAAFMQKEDAVVFSTGYQTNLGVVAALAGENDVVIMDKLDHASLVDGARLSQATVARFRHNDLDSLEQVLQQNAGRPKLVVVDSVFSMEGTIADLRSIVGLAKRHGARVMVDEAHAIGVLGPGGRGAAELLGVLGEVDLVMGTFSKSLASVGGFVAGDARLIDYLKHAARSHMFSASLPPASVAATRAALEIVKREPERRARVLGNAEYMARRLQELGYDAPFRGTAIVPVYCNDMLLTFGLYRKLLDEGVFVNPVAPPAVASGREMLRTSYMATHEQGMLDAAAHVFAKLRTAAFPRRKQVALSRPASQLRVRPMVLLPVADCGSLARYCDGGEPTILRVPGHTKLPLGQSVDCGISLGREGVVLQAQGQIVSKRLVPAAGRSLGIDVELLPGEPGARDVIERLLTAGGLPPAARRGWRYHAEMDVEYEAAPEPGLAALEDISACGAAIRCQKQPGLGEHVALRLKTPEGVIGLCGQVRWRRRADPVFGVQFEFASRNERARFESLIRTLRSESVAGASAAVSAH